MRYSINGHNILDQNGNVVGDWGYNHDAFNNGWGMYEVTLNGHKGNCHSLEWITN